MLVQAQYPSNVIYQNRNVQEEKGQNAGEGFIDQSQILFSNGVGANPRKRTRDILATNSSTPINPFSLQLAFVEQQQQHQLQSLSSQSSLLYSALSDDLATQIRHQTDEIEQLLNAQGERLRRTLAEKRHRHYRVLLGAAEKSVTRQLREKEVEVQKASQHNDELEAQFARLGAEARSWQARARAGEAAAAALQAQLQRAMMSDACTHDPLIEDAGSSYMVPDQVVVVANNNRSYDGPTCKACLKGVATVVLFPCRHLCLCTNCDHTFTNQACPVCFSFKESSVEVYFS